MGENLHNDVIYVAVNQDVRESKLTLLWTLKTLPVNKICLLHVHLPCSLTPSPRLDERDIIAIQESEQKTSYNSLYKYRDICISKGVNEEDVDTSVISGHGVGEGIVELIYRHNIKKLVMGAAADPHYSRGMSITSRKAEYVSQHAPRYCKMWFVCKGKLIKKREGSFDLGKPSQGIGRDENKTDPYKEHPPEPDFSVTQPKGANTKRDGSGADTSPCAPQDYLCPISLDIMQDPHVAADGFTYEAKNIRTWLSRGNHTSPKTGARLDNLDLTPNYTLRAIIKDWLQQHPNYEH